jgi:hypothetical protein
MINIQTNIVTKINKERGHLDFHFSQPLGVKTLPDQNSCDPEFNSGSLHINHSPIAMK